MITLVYTTLGMFIGKISDFDGKVMSISDSIQLMLVPTQQGIAFQMFQLGMTRIKDEHIQSTCELIKTSPLYSQYLSTLSNLHLAGSKN